MKLYTIKNVVTTSENVFCIFQLIVLHLTLKIAIRKNLRKKTLLLYESKIKVEIINFIQRRKNVSRNSHRYH